MSLRPVAGESVELLAELRDWVGGAGGPLTISTSGSSGRAKDVILSNRAVVASAMATHERLGGDGQWLLALPASGVAGLQVLVRSIIAGQDPVVAADHPTLGSAVAAMSGPRQYASLVPTQLHRLAVSGELAVLAGLDALLIGGAPINATLLAQTRAAGVNVVRTYGMSETCGGCVYDGIPLGGVEIRIDDDRQIHLSGPMLFDGYGDPDSTASVLRDGWFATADLGEFATDGRLRVLGRSDDVVISGGVNVSLPAVTDALRAVPGLTNAYVVAVDDPEWGQRVVAAVVGESTLEVIRDEVEAAGLPRTWAPKQLLVIDDVPLLPGGKVDRQALKLLATAT